jgi:REP element-mobilizing transposase RayT
MSSNEKYKNKYRIPTNRLRGYNYNADGCYYITICTKSRIHYFGEIMNNEMQLSEIGKIATMEWFKTPSLRLDMNLELDKFIVMPNHIHGIVMIGENQYNTPKHNGTHCELTQCRDALQCVSTNDAKHCKLTQRRDAMHCVSTFGPQTKNLASIIRGFKIAVTTYARKHNIDFEWQERFYDRIIRNQKGLDYVREYIFNNPQNWNNDELNVIL